MAEDSQPLAEEFNDIEIQPARGYTYERLGIELANIEKLAPDGLAITIKDDDLFRWRVTIDGPKGTPYEGGKFAMKLYFPSGYPENPPMITFKTKIYHPNVDSFGIVHIDILLPMNWSPAMPVSDILNTVLNVLVEPKPTEYCDPTILQHFQQNREQFFEKAKDWTRLYAVKRTVFKVRGLSKRNHAANLICCGKQSSYTDE